jgi:Beta-glucosidase-related glycosidases
MNLAACIGQTLCIGLQGTTLTTETRAFIQKHKIGNVILFSRSIESREQMIRLTNEVQALVLECTGHPALISIDQEGGVVQRLPADAVSIPGAMAVSAAGSEEDAYKLGLGTGAQLRELGANFDLAPSLDVNSNPENPVIGVRSYGSDPKRVAAFGLAMARGLMDGGSLPCVKHFPGHGDTAVDSHIGLPVVEKTAEELEKVELYPFRQAVKEKIPCVMTTHIVFPKIDESGLPATLSKKILTELLREKLGFDGMVITDCLEMQAIQAHYGTAEGAVMALGAGADLLCISHTLALAEEAIKQISAAVQNGTLPETRVRDAANRVLHAKSLLPAPAKPLADIDSFVRCAAEVRERSLTLLRGDILKPDADTFFIGSLAYRSTLASSAADGSISFPKEMAAAFSADYRVISVNPDAEEIAACVKAANRRNVVVGLYNAQFNAGQLQLCKALSESGCTLTAIALRNPYDLLKLEEAATAIAAYEYTHAVFKALIRLLRGEIKPQGKVLF